MKCVKSRRNPGCRRKVKGKIIWQVRVREGEGRGDGFKLVVYTPSLRISRTF